MTAGDGKKFALFFGCSFVYGEGVQDQETLPARFAEESGLRAYNYGYGGWGPQHMLARLTETRIEDEVGEREGIAVYQFLGFHVARAAGTMRVLWPAFARSPYYTLDGDKLVRAGSFVSGRPWRTRLYRWLRKSNILARLDVDLPRVGAPELALTVRMIDASAAAFRTRFPGGRFVVLLYPQCAFEENRNCRLAKELMPLLDAAHLEYVDLSRLPLHELTSGRETIARDGHPSPEAYRVVARELARALGVKR